MMEPLNTECGTRGTDSLPPERGGRSLVRLHIERLVLDGVPMDGHHTALLKAAVEAELAALLAKHGLASQPRAEALVAGGEIRLHPLATTGQLGGQIGRSIYTAFSLPDHEVQPLKGNAP